MKRRDRIASRTEAPCGAAECVPDCGGSPSGPRPRSRGSFSINSAMPAADDGGESAEHEIGAAPSQASRSSSDASGGITSVPTPMPLTASPDANPRRRTNQRCTAPMAGT